MQIAGEDGIDGGEEQFLFRVVADGLKEFVDDDDVPERGVDGVVFGCAALIGEAVGEHAFGNGVRPRDENVAGLGQPAGGEAEAAEGDERVAAPIAEPRVAGDDGFPRIAADDIGVAGAQAGRGKGGAAGSFVGGEGVVDFCWGKRKAKAFGGEDQDGRTGTEVEFVGNRARLGLPRNRVRERVPRRREEVAIPGWRVIIDAVAGGGDFGNAVVEMPDFAFVEVSAGVKRNAGFS